MVPVVQPNFHACVIQAGAEMVVGDGVGGAIVDEGTEFLDSNGSIEVQAIKTKQMRGTREHCAGKVGGKT
eukprot:479579-Ditylum_brightwellii.AAC.1